MSESSELNVNFAALLLCLCYAYFMKSIHEMGKFVCA